MATERLIIELDAKTSALTQELDKVNKRIDDLDGSVDSADTSLSSFGGTALSVAGTVVDFTAGVAAAGAALTAFITVTARSNQELAGLADQVGVTTEEFQALSFATEQYGITAEQLGDISKDISDKLGEFASSGTGAFQDFADVLGLSQEEAIATAKEFENLSSDQVIGEVVRQLEEAGATANQTTFVLESLGNDLSKLTPLFADNSAQLNELTERYAKFNDELALTGGQQEDLQAVATSFSLLTSTLGNSAQVIASSVAPQFESFFNAVIEIVPDATNTIVDFINTFQDAAQIQSESSLTRLIEEQRVAIEELTEKQNEFKASSDSILGVRLQQQTANIQFNQQIAEETQRLEELEAQLVKVQEAETARLEAASQRTGGEFSGLGTTTNLDLETQDDTESQIQAIQERFKTEEQLLAEKLERELEIIGENNELKLQLEAEYQNNLLDLEIARVDEEIAAEERRSKSLEDQRRADLKAQQDADKAKISSTLSYADAAIAVGNLVFEDNKAVRAGLVVADTAAGITRAFADLPYPAALAASASIAATGAAQLSTINSATKGGSTTATASAATPVDTDIPETTELTVSESDVSGANNQLTLKIEADDSDVANSIASLLESAQVTGTLG